MFSSNALEDVSLIAKAANGSEIINITIAKTSENTR
jgi:hypothetical protein